MEVKRVRLLKTLKTETLTWVKGGMHQAPFHPELQAEIEHELARQPVDRIFDVVEISRSIGSIKNPTTTTTMSKTSNFSKRPRALR